MDTLTLLRQYRIGPFAIFDTVLSYVGILILSPLLSVVRLSNFKCDPQYQPQSPA